MQLTEADEIAHDPRLHHDLIADRVACLIEVFAHAGTLAVRRALVSAGLSGPMVQAFGFGPGFTGHWFPTDSRICSYHERVRTAFRSRRMKRPTLAIACVIVASGVLASPAFGLGIVGFSPTDGQTVTTATPTFTISTSGFDPSSSTANP